MASTSTTARVSRPAPVTAPAGGEQPSAHVRELGAEASGHLPTATTLALPLLLQLRWLAIGGQSALLGLGWSFGAPLPFGVMWGLVLLALASNLGLRAYGDRLELGHSLPLVLTFDTLLLTALLSLSGGPHNPFTALYVVHVALGAVATTPRGTAWIALLSGLGYAAMFRWHLPLELWHRGMDHAAHASGPAAVGAHLIGMWVALTIVAATIAYFITRLVQQLANVRAVAARNERLASLTTLAAGAAHELGSPLGTIAVASREIARASEGSVHDDAELIRDEVQRCRSILDRMSGSVSGATATLDNAPLGVIVEEVLEALGTSGSRVVVEWIGCVREQACPRAPVRQALTTLLRNALDASDALVELRAERSRGHLLSSICDTGPGVPPDVLARLGEPFITTKDPGRGTGLGIYVVRLIAEQLGGSLRFETSPRRGTRATLSLPLMDAPTRTPRTSTERRSAHPLGIRLGVRTPQVSE